MAGQSRREPGVVVLAGADPDWMRILPVLDLLPGVRLIAIETVAERVLRLTARERPAVVLICADALRRCGAELVTRLQSASPRTAILMAGSTSKLRAVRAVPGIAGRLDTAHLTPERLRIALLAAASGLRVDTPEEQDPQPPVELTKHEREALDGLRRGLTEQAMCETYHLGRGTVTRAIESLEQKFGIRGRFMLGARAAWLGLIEEENDGTG